jgi:hypothetical protein
MSNSEHYLATVAERVCRGAITIEDGLAELVANGQARSARERESLRGVLAGALSSHKLAEIEAEIEAEARWGLA